MSPQIRPDQDPLRGCERCLSQTSLPSLTWKHFVPPPGSLPAAWNQRAGGGIRFPPQLKGNLSPARDERMTSGERLRKEGNYYARGESASPAGPVWEEEDLDLTVDREKPEIPGNGCE